MHCYRRWGVVNVLVMKDVDDLIFGVTRVMIEVSEGKNRNLLRMEKRRRDCLGVVV